MFFIETAIKTAYTAQEDSTNRDAAQGRTYIPHECGMCGLADGVLCLSAQKENGGNDPQKGGQPIAIYHCSIKIISRDKGKSAVAAAYWVGEKLTNEFDGETHNYTHKGGGNSHSPHGPVFVFASSIKLKYDSDHKESLAKYPELREHMQSLLQQGEKITPKQWKAKIQSLQNEYDSISRKNSKTATELAYAEVISYNRKNLERKLQNENRQHNKQQSRTKRREEEI